MEKQGKKAFNKSTAIKGLGKGQLPLLGPKGASLPLPSGTPSPEFGAGPFGPLAFIFTLFCPKSIPIAAFENVNVKTTNTNKIFFIRPSILFGEIAHNRS